jgi:ATP-dependent Clp protease adaptor protein ClpS
MVKTATNIEEEIAAIFSGNTPWVTIVWDDPINLMTYVTYSVTHVKKLTSS